MYRFGPLAALGAREGTDQKGAVVARQRSGRRAALRTPGFDTFFFVTWGVTISCVRPTPRLSGSAASARTATTIAASHGLRRSSARRQGRRAGDAADERARICAAVVRAGATSIAWAMPAGAGVRRHDDPGRNRK